MKALLIIALILSSSFAKIAKPSLQTLRGEYKPKMPSSITGATKLIEGKKTQSVADQEEI
jgi:pyrophosphate--fructose-6-phosphate 1-phosphotransferase